MDNPDKTAHEKIGAEFMKALHLAGFSLETHENGALTVHHVSGYKTVVLSVEELPYPMLTHLASLLVDFYKRPRPGHRGVVKFRDRDKDKS